MKMRTYGDISIEIAHDGPEGGVLEEFCGDVEWLGDQSVVSSSLSTIIDRWSVYALNKRTTPSDAWRKIEVSIPSSVMGTSAKD